MQTQNIEAAIKSLKKLHRTAWMDFRAKTENIVTVLGKRMGCDWSHTEDITDHVTTEDIKAAGFNEDEAAAITFAMTEDCMGQHVNSVDMLDRWFCYCVR